MPTTLYACGVADKVSSLNSRQAVSVGGQASKRYPQNAMTKSAARVWPNAVVPYVIDHNLRKLRESINCV